MSKQKAKGTKFETLIVDYCRVFGADVERRAQQGANDKGDFTGFEDFAVEAKNHVKMDLAGWWAEAQAEAKNLGVPYAAVIHKRKGKGGAHDQWVTMTVFDWFDLMVKAGLVRGME